MKQRKIFSAQRKYTLRTCILLKNFTINSIQTIFMLIKKLNIIIEIKNFVTKLYSILVLGLLKLFVL